MQSNINLRTSIHVIARQALIVQIKSIMKTLMPEVTKVGKQLRSIKQTMRQIIKNLFAELERLK